MDLTHMRAYVAEYEKIDCDCRCHTVLFDNFNCGGGPCCVIWGQKKIGDPDLVREMKAVIKKMDAIDELVEIMESEQLVAPEGFVYVDAHDCWPDGIVADMFGRILERPEKGTMILAPLPSEL